MAVTIIPEISYTPESDEELAKHNQVNKQNFLQVFQRNGIRKMEDNLTSADLLSYIPGRPGTLKWSNLALHEPTTQLPVEPRIKNIEQTDSNHDPPLDMFK